MDAKNDFNIMKKKTKLHFFRWNANRSMSALVRNQSYGDSTEFKIILDYNHTAGNMLS